MKSIQNILTIWLLASCSLWANDWKTYVFQGKIDNKLDIVIKFDADSKSACTTIAGDYLYTSTCEPMEIEGEWCMSKKTLTIKRMKDGKLSETFSFTNFDGKNGTGTWTKGSQKLNCTIYNLETKTPAATGFAAAYKAINAKHPSEASNVLAEANQHGATFARTESEVENDVTFSTSKAYFQVLPHATNLIVLTAQYGSWSTCKKFNNSTQQCDEYEEGAEAFVRVYQWTNNQLKEIPNTIKLGKTDELNVWGEYFVATNPETKARQIWHWNGTTLVKMK